MTDCEVTYPSFHKEVIDEVSDNDAPHWIINFPFLVKGRRHSDIVILNLGTRDRPGRLMFYENPSNWDSDKSYVISSMVRCKLSIL